MSLPRLSAEGRIALYDYYRDRREHFRKEAYRHLGGSCSNCGAANQLLHRFLDPNNPLAARYRKNPGTLLRRICVEPELREEIILLCRECRLELGSRRAVSHEVSR